MHINPIPEQQPAGRPMGLTPESQLLAIRGLACTRNDVTLVRDLDFMLETGEILLIEGENGSGKTTLLRILCGLLEPEAGQVLWCGSDIRTDYAGYLHTLSYVGHANAIKLGLTPLENLAFARDMAKAGEVPGLLAILDRFGLGRCADVPAQYLSAGQRRRLALSRLLLERKPLWILDEPFTALDSAGRNLLRGIFADHLADNGGIIMTSHDHLSWQDPPLRSIRLQ